MRPRSDRGILGLVMALTLLMGLFAERTAEAQGTSGTVADPLSLRATSDLLTRYTEIRPEQRIVIEEAHDRYLEAFERLREGEIRDFLNLTRELEGGNAGVFPSVEQMDRLFKEWASVNRRVAALDAAFFEQIRGSLDDEQADAIGRARLIRDRARILASNGMTMRGGQYGIDEMFWKIDPTMEERAAVDDVLRGLESSMPRLAEDLAEASVGMIREMVRVMVESGFEGLTEQDMADPAVMQEMMTAMQTAQQAAMAPMMEAQAEIEDRDIAASKVLRGRLAPDRWHRLKRMWVSASYPFSGLGVTGGNATDVPRHADSVREALIGDEVRQAQLDSLLRAWYAADDRITDELIETSRRQQAAQFDDPMSMAANPFRSKLSEGLEERRETARNAIRGILELVPDPEVRAAIEAGIASGESMIVQGGMEIPIVAETDDGVVVVEGVAALTGVARGTNNIPVPISTRDLALVKWLLDLGPEQAAVIDMLYADYLESWGGNVSPRLEEANDVPIFGERGRRKQAAAVEERWRLLGAALEAVLEVDREFFAAVDVAVGGESRPGGLAAAEIQRGFDRIASISASRFDGIFGLPVIEPSSPYPLLEELDLEDGLKNEVLVALFARNDDLARAIEGWEPQRMESDRALELASAEFEATADSMRGEAPEELMAAAAAAGQRYFEKMAESSTRRLRNADRRRAIVQAVVEEALIPVLPPLAGLEVRVAMFDEGWSGVRNTESGLEIARKVLRLRDLTPDQMVVVESLLLDHLDREAGLIASMSDEIERIREGDGGMAEMMRSSEISEKFGFRRGEMQERLVQRLLAVLSPEQIARIPALARRVD